MINPSSILSHLPSGLINPLIKSYEEITTNYAEHRWEPSELNGGKFCEIVYTIIEGYIKGSFASKPSKPSNMVTACQGLEKIASDPARVGDRSVRILIPRVLMALYEIRNNRGVGHAGGDVDPNYLDATVVYSMSSWVLAELIRIFHNVSTKEAQEIVDLLIERKSTLIWEIDGTRRVLDPSMTKGDQVLLLLHTKPGWVNESDLLKWIEHSNPTVFRKNILETFHKSRLIEYDKKQNKIRISPLGIKEVEKRILPKFR